MTTENLPSDTLKKQWFALRDLKRPNDPDRAYLKLSKHGFEVFTPLEQRKIDKYGKHLLVYKPIFPDMLFAHSTWEELNPYVSAISSLQYRLRIGYTYPKEEGVIVIDDRTMNNFRLACDSEIPKEYLKSADIDSSMIGRRVKIICQSVPDGFEGNLLRVRGRGLKVIVRLPNLIDIKLSLSKNDLVQFVDGRKK